MKLPRSTCGVALLLMAGCGANTTGGATTAGGAGGGGPTGTAGSGDGTTGGTSASGGQGGTSADGGAGGHLSGVGGQGPGGGAQGSGGASPTGEECLALTTREACEAAGCLIGWSGIYLVSIVDDECVSENVTRCLHASSFDNPGAAMSLFWREVDGVPEVYLMSSFCDAEGLTPCLGSITDPHPDEPAACVCSGGPYCG